MIARRHNDSGAGPGNSRDVAPAQSGEGAPAETSAPGTRAPACSADSDHHGSACPPSPSRGERAATRRLLVAKRRAEGKTLEAIGAELGVTRARAGQLAIEAGCEPRESIAARVLALLGDGRARAPKEIAFELGVIHAENKDSAGRVRTQILRLRDAGLVHAVADPDMPRFRVLIAVGPGPVSRRAPRACESDREAFNAEVLAAIAAGESQAAIGRRVGLTSSRISQIYRRHVAKLAAGAAGKETP